MYRPKDWTNPLTLANRVRDHNDLEDVAEAYEAGADAMLEAVRKQSLTTPDLLYLYMVSKGREERKSGRLVFIPDDTGTDDGTA